MKTKDRHIQETTLSPSPAYICQNSFILDHFSLAATSDVLLSSHCTENPFSFFSTLSSFNRFKEHIIITCHGSVSFDVYGGKDKIREFTSPHIDEDGRNED
ncbi:hypothetical protein QL285_076923 [Trifolium repens]|nr:hypothetical protein QL285_076923 [Trifolium repens]